MSNLTQNLENQAKEFTPEKVVVAPKKGGFIKPLVTFVAGIFTALGTVKLLNKGKKVKEAEQGEESTEEAVNNEE